MPKRLPYVVPPALFGAMFAPFIVTSLYWLGALEPKPGFIWLYRYVFTGVSLLLVGGLIYTLAALLWNAHLRGLNDRVS